MGAQPGTLIIATSLIQLANGFFGTFISLRVTIEDFGPVMSGLVLSSYFAGFTLGALLCERIIERIGHIRAYAAFAGLVVAATAAMPLLPGPLSWLTLRFVVGFGCAGIFTATESWLNAKAEPAQRGRVFSTYMFGTFVALALGQLLIGRANIEAVTPFNAIAALFAVALVMVALRGAKHQHDDHEGLMVGVTAGLAPCPLTLHVTTFTQSADTDGEAVTTSRLRPARSPGAEVRSRRRNVALTWGNPNGTDDDDDDKTDFIERDGRRIPVPRYDKGDDVIEGEVAPPPAMIEHREPEVEVAPVAVAVELEPAAPVAVPELLVWGDPYSSPPPLVAHLYQANTSKPRGGPPQPVLPRKVIYE